MYVIQEVVNCVEVIYGIILCGVVICICYEGFEIVKCIVFCVVEIVGDWIIGFGMGGDEGKGY